MHYHGVCSVAIVHVSLHEN